MSRRWCAELYLSKTCCVKDEFELPEGILSKTPAALPRQRTPHLSEEQLIKKHGKKAARWKCHYCQRYAFEVTYRTKIKLLSYIHDWDTKTWQDDSEDTFFWNREKVTGIKARAVTNQDLRLYVMAGVKVTQYILDTKMVASKQLTGCAGDRL